MLTLDMVDGRVDMGGKVEGGTQVVPAKLLTDKADSSGKPSTKARTKGESRATQVVKAAEALFGEQGYSATSMDDLAREVGILKGSLYYYVDSKEDLLFRIVENVHRGVDGLIEQARQAEVATPLDRVVLYVESQLRRNTENLVELTVYHNDWRRLGGERLAAVIEWRRHHDQALIAMLAEAQEAGQVGAGVDLRLAAAHIYAVAIWPYTWYNPGGSISSDALVRSGAEFIRSGLAGLA